ncbi:MAG: apolipoprotein N-acyltransferase [Syntrophobacteraceae bacterium]|nr:apolipoprotein N-acyltransferase [Syntrophobacteraceae bacterium]
MYAILLSVLSGLLLSAGFPKPAMFYLAWVALVPLLLAVRGRSAKRALMLGYLCGFVHSLTCLYWIDYAIYHFGGFSFVLSCLILSLLCAIMAIYPALFALAAQKFEGFPALYVFGLPFVWVTLEWIRAHVITGFPWADLGYTQTPLLHLVQVADLTGVYGVSWLVVLAGTVISGFIANYCRRSGVVVLAGMIALVLTYGFVRAAQIERLEHLQTALNVSVVQGNISQDEKWDRAAVDKTIQTYGRLSAEAARKNPAPDLIVWPESAMPFFYGINRTLSLKVEDVVKNIGKPLLFGSLGVAPSGGKVHLLNSAYLLDGGAALLGSYAKQHLVPFGEYVPWMSLFSFAKSASVGPVDFVPGKNPGPVILKGLPLGVLICYEDIFAGIARKTVQRGAEVLINITNDAWYGDTSGPYQELEISRWRAIECRVPLARAANTGISAVFDATGREQGSLALDRSGFLTCAVYPMSYLSFYVTYGDLFAWLCVFCSFCAIILRLMFPIRSAFSGNKK